MTSGSEEESVSVGSQDEDSSEENGNVENQAEEGVPNIPQNSGIIDNNPLLADQYEGDRIIENPNLKNFLIYWYFAKGEFMKSQMHLDQWKAFTCNNYEFAHWIQALIHRRNGRLNESLKYFKLCHVIDPDNPAFLKQISKTLKLLGRFKTAFRVAKDALSKSPDDWELYYLLAGIKENQGDFAEAKEYLTEASKHSRNRKVVLKFGEMHSLEGKYEWANRLLLKFAEQNTLDSDIAAELGSLYLESNKIAEACHYFGLALSQDPRNKKVLLGLGSLSQEFFDSEGALMKYRIYNAEDTNAAEIWNNIGMCYFEKESYIGAISCLKKALYLNPIQPVIYFNLGLIYLTMEQYSSAFHYILTSIKYNQQNAQAYMFLGICLKELNDNGNAYNAYMKAIDIEPENHLIYLNLAIFMASCGPEKHSNAKEYFEKHDELFKSHFNASDPNKFEIESQRNALSDILGVQI